VSVGGTSKLLSCFERRMEAAGRLLCLVRRSYFHNKAMRKRAIPVIATFQINDRSNG
jgi:hypothetical protein